MMSTGAGAMLQGPYVLQAGYPRVQMPQFPSQFMPMRAGVGMGIYGMSCSTAPPMMPFPLASPCQSTLAASGMAMVGPMHQLQLPLNPLQPLPSADFWFHFDSCSNIFYKLSFDVSLYRSSRNQFTHVPLMSKISGIDSKWFKCNSSAKPNYNSCFFIKHQRNSRGSTHSGGRR